MPCTIQAGVTFESSAPLKDYPAPTWMLSAHLRGPQAINLESLPAGAAHAFAELASVTAEWPAGIYAYTVRATNGTDVRQVEVGTLEVLADVVAITGVHDPRTHAAKTLEAIQAVIQKRASHDQERYVINNRELWRTPLGDLLKLRDTYRAEVRREKAAARGRSLWGPAVRVRL